MQITPEVKAQLAEQKKNCIHCKLISGEMEGAKTIFKDEKTTSMLDIYPVVKGHSTYMLIEHYPMPAYIPGEEFIHMFALIPKLAKAIKKGMVRTGFNVSIPVGNIAGQTSSHFLVHLLPREKGDGFNNFLFTGKGEAMEQKSIQMLQNNLPIMMRNHFGRHPASWHLGKGEVPSFLAKIYNGDSVIYEDEQALVVAPKFAESKGHLIVYSKVEEKLIENLTQDQSAHLFFTASFASTAVFEGLGCQATNVILKSGFSDDNPNGTLALHVFGRWQNDALKINWQASQTQDNLDPIQSQIKEEMWIVNYEEDKNSNSKQKSNKKKSSTANNNSRKTESLKDIASRIAPKKNKSSKQEIEDLIGKLQD